MADKVLVSELPSRNRTTSLSNDLTSRHVCPLTWYLRPFVKNLWTVLNRWRSHIGSLSQICHLCHWCLHTAINILVLSWLSQIYRREGCRHWRDRVLFGMVHGGQLRDDTMWLHVFLYILLIWITASETALLLLATICSNGCQIRHINSFQEHVGAVIIGRMLLNRGNIRQHGLCVLRDPLRTSTIPRSILIENANNDHALARRGYWSYNFLLPFSWLSLVIHYLHRGGVISFNKFFAVRALLFRLFNHSIYLID